MNNITKIPNALNVTIIDSDLTEVSKACIESGIDSIMNDGLLKDIPIVGMLVGLVKTGQSFSNFLFLRKILSFLNGIDDIDPKERGEMINKIDESQKYKNKVGEQLLFTINHSEDDIKSGYIGTLFRTFITKEITYDEFLKGSFIINGLSNADFEKFILQEAISLENSEFIAVGLAFIWAKPVTVIDEVTSSGDWGNTPKFITSGGETDAVLTDIGEKLKKIFAKEITK